VFFRKKKQKIQKKTAFFCINFQLPGPEQIIFRLIFYKKERYYNCSVKKVKAVLSVVKASKETPITVPQSLDHLLNLALFNTQETPVSLLQYMVKLCFFP